MYSFSISNYNNNELLKGPNNLNIVNSVTGTLTFSGMVAFGVVVIITKVYGAKVSLAYAEKIAKLRTAKLK